MARIRKRGGWKLKEKEESRGDREGLRRRRRNSFKFHNYSSYMFSYCFYFELALVMFYLGLRCSRVKNSVLGFFFI